MKKDLPEIHDCAIYPTHEDESSESDEKMDKNGLIAEFRAYSDNIKSSGLLYCSQLKDI